MCKSFLVLVILFTELIVRLRFCEIRGVCHVCFSEQVSMVSCNEIFTSHTKQRVNFGFGSFVSNVCIKSIDTIWLAKCEMHLKL